MVVVTHRTHSHSTKVFTRSPIFTFFLFELCLSARIFAEVARRNLAGDSFHCFGAFVPGLMYFLGSYMEEFFCEVTSSLIGSNVWQDHVGTERQQQERTGGWSQD